MVLKRLNKKGATVKDTFMVILIGIFVCGGLFIFIKANALEAGIAVPDNVNSSFNSLQQQQDELDELQTSLRNTLSGDISEADAGDFGYFGLKGILSLILSPITIINIALNSLAIITGLSDSFYIPQYIISALSIGIAIIIIFTLIALAANRGKEP